MGVLPVELRVHCLRLPAIKWVALERAGGTQHVVDLMRLFLQLKVLLWFVVLRLFMVPFLFYSTFDFPFETDVA